jgi:MYXO-CTERM domain-containing protein
MKLAAFCVLGLIASPVLGSTYIDPVGDIATGNSNLDITQVDITDNGTDLTVQLTVDSLDGDWGKYMFFMDTGLGGSDDTDNPWFRDVSGLSGMDWFVGSWLDGGGGAAMYEHLGDDGWIQFLTGISVEVDWANNTIEWNFSNLVEMLVMEGATGFDFEFGTTGGGMGDPAIDLIGAEGTQPGWGGGSTSTDLSHYDFSTVPAPGALALLGLAGLTSRRRRRH